MAADQTLYLCETSLQYLTDGAGDPVFSYSPFCSNVLFTARIGFFVSMIFCNALMWTVFTKALRMSPTTLEATVTNTAANFFFTAIYGQVFFGETLSLMWWLGTAMIITGLLLMQQSIQEMPLEEPKQKKKRK